MRLYEAAAATTTTTTTSTAIKVLPKKALSWRQTAASTATLAAPIYFTQLRVCAYRTPSETGRAIDREGETERERVRKIGRYTKCTYLYEYVCMYMPTYLSTYTHTYVWAITSSSHTHTHIYTLMMWKKNITMRQFRLKQRAATPRACKGSANCKKRKRKEERNKPERESNRVRGRQRCT